MGTMDEKDALGTRGIDSVHRVGGVSMADKNGRATLGCNAGYTVFSGGGSTIRFRAPYSLKRYVGVKEWDKGYLVVDAEYSHSPVPVEEYIDLVPILEDLYMDPAGYLEGIREVEVAHA